MRRRSRNEGQTQLKDVMERCVKSVSPDTLLWEAARRMSALKMPMLPVCDAHKLVGAVTPRDLIVRATAQGCNPHTSTVREVMTRELICAQEDQTINEAAALMRRYRLSGLFVVDRQQNLVGVLPVRGLRKFTVRPCLTVPKSTTSRRSRIKLARPRRAR
jgi:CBS domain-containing protein